VALSNWAVLALSHDGKPMSGDFKTPLGIGAEIYKSWLYVRDPVAWREGGGFVKNTVMEVKMGSLHYMDLNIIAARGQEEFPESIYAAVWSGWDYDEKSRASFSGMVGIGTYGFKSFGRQDADADLESLWEGVRVYEVEWLKELMKRWSDEYSLPKTLADLDLSKALQFNRGNLFFAENLGVELPVSKPGEKQHVYMNDVIEGMKKAENDPPKEEEKESP
jgi:hypothetical protein